MAQGHLIGGDRIDEGNPLAVALGGDQHVAVVSDTAPTDPSTNQLWYDTTEEQLKRWDGAAWQNEGKDTSVAVIGASAIAANFGAPSRTADGPAGHKRVGWTLPDDLTYSIEGQIVVPDGWTSVNVKAQYAKTTTNNGDIDVGITHSQIGDGTVYAKTAEADVIHTVPATQWELDEVTLVSGLAVTAGRTLTLEMRRETDANTLVGAIHVVALVVMRA